MATDRRHASRYRYALRPPQWPPPEPWVPIESARVLLVDPAYLPPHHVRNLMAERLAVVVQGNCDGPAILRLDGPRERGPARSLTLWSPGEWEWVYSASDAGAIELADDDDGLAGV